MQNGWVYTCNSDHEISEKLKLRDIHVNLDFKSKGKHGTFGKGYSLRYRWSSREEVHLVSKGNECGNGGNGCWIKR